MSKFDFAVTNVTGVARDGSDIQETIKAFFEKDLEAASYDRSHKARFEEYDDEGAKALAVIVDDKEIGSIKGEDAAEVSALAGKNNDYVVSFGINGHDIDEYEKIIDRYKDKKFWKEEDPNFNVPTIALTADAVAGAVEHYKEVGFNDYLAKPFTRDQIKEKLDILFK